MMNEWTLILCLIHLFVFLFVKVYFVFIFAFILKSSIVYLFKQCFRLLIIALLFAPISCKKKEVTDFEYKSTGAFNPNRLLRQSSVSVSQQSVNAKLSALASSSEMTGCSGLLRIFYGFTTGYPYEQYQLDNLRSQFRVFFQQKIILNNAGIFNMTPEGLYYQNVPDSFSYLDYQPEMIQAFNEAKMYLQMQYVNLNEHTINIYPEGVFCNGVVAPHPGGGTPNPGGGGSDDDDPGNPTNPTNPTNPLEVPKKNPCIEKNLITALSLNPNIAQQIVALRNVSNGKEWGFPQTLSSLSNNTAYMDKPIYTNELAEEVSVPYTWNSVDGYTVGTIHNHPGDTGPSFYDIFSIYEKYKNIQFSNQAERDFYKTNASITIVTSSSVFVVSITDWAAFDNKWWDYNQDRAAYETTFLDAASGFSDQYTMGVAEAHMILNLLHFNNVATIYQRKYNETDFIPLRAGLLNGRPSIGPINCN